jgi:type III restriction enzyme
MLASFRGAAFSLPAARAIVDTSFYEKPILNSPYAYPGRHWELDADGQPTNRLIESRRRSDLVTPVPKPKTGRIAVKVINHLGDEVMKVFAVP